MNAEDAALLAQMELTQRRLALRDHAWSGAPAEDLRWLNVPEPELRWAAACDLIHEFRDAQVRKINRAVVQTIAVGLADENAAARDAAGWISVRDLYAARPRVGTYFGAKALPVIDALIPIAEDDHVRYVG